jgi:hypothetical protein
MVLNIYFSLSWKYKNMMCKKYILVLTDVSLGPTVYYEHSAGVPRFLKKPRSHLNIIVAEEWGMN